MSKHGLQRLKQTYGNSSIVNSDKEKGGLYDGDDVDKLFDRLMQEAEDTKTALALARTLLRLCAERLHRLNCETGEERFSGISGYELHAFIREIVPIEETPGEEDVRKELLFAQRYGAHEPKPDKPTIREEFPLPEDTEASSAREVIEEQYNDLAQAVADVLFPFRHAMDAGHDGLLRWVRSHKAAVEGKIAEAMTQRERANKLGLQYRELLTAATTALLLTGVRAPASHEETVEWIASRQHWARDLCWKEKRLRDVAELANAPTITSSGMPQWPRDCDPRES